MLKTQYYTLNPLISYFTKVLDQMKGLPFLLYKNVIIYVKSIFTSLLFITFKIFESYIQ